MDFILKRFDKLSKNELYQILKLRAAVFIVEQNCPYQDLDDKDQMSYHLAAFDNGTLVAYVRISQYYETVHISRVISVRRRSGLGTEMMERAIDFIKTEINPERIEVEAQLYVKEFYTKLGFVQMSEPYTLDEIPHIRMELIL